MKHQVANVGSTGVSINPGGSSGSPNQSQVTLYLHERADRQVRNTFTTMEVVRAGLADIVGANIKVDAPQDGPPTGAPVSVRILGDELDEIGRLAEEVKTRIRGIEGLVNLDDDLEGGKPELRVEVDREEAMRSGVNTQIIAATVQTGILGAEASKYRVGEDEHDIRVRLAPDARASLDDIGELTVPDEDGIPVPIRTVAKLTHGVGPAAVRRVDLNRVATIEGDVVRESGRTEAGVREEVAAELDAMVWPPGYRWEFSGANQEEQQATAFLSRAFVIALLLIMMVLVTQFDSLILPLTIITSVALSVIGVLWGLMLTGTAFGIIMTGIGVISLAGIVVNNAIVLCDFVRQLRERGLSRHDAVVEAGSIRLRPVLLTAVTTVLGLIPLTLGTQHRLLQPLLLHGGESSQFWASMGVAVIFGLTVATVLTLVVVPSPTTASTAFPRPSRTGARNVSAASSRWKREPSIRRVPSQERRCSPGIARAGETPIANREEARGRSGAPVFTPPPGELGQHRPHSGRNSYRQSGRSAGTAWNADLWPRTPQGQDGVDQTQDYRIAGARRRFAGSALTDPAHRTG